MAAPEPPAHVASAAPVFVDPTGRRSRVVRWIVLGVSGVLLVYLLGFTFELTRSPWVHGIGLPGVGHRTVTAQIPPTHVTTTPFPHTNAESADHTLTPSGTTGGSSTTTSRGTGSGNAPATTTPGAPATSPATSPTTAAPATTTATTTHPGNKPTTSTVPHGKKP